MEKPLNQIYETLKKLTGFHRQLLDAVRRERDALVHADLKGIQGTTATKQGLIEAIRQAEVERLRLIGELAMQWKKPLRELTLPQIVIAIQGRDPNGAEQLRSVFNTLTVLIQRITEGNEENQGIVERSLEHVRAMTHNVLGESAPKSGTYTSCGQKTPPSGGARLISREA